MAKSKASKKNFTIITFGAGMVGKTSVCSNAFAQMMDDQQKAMFNQSVATLVNASTFPWKSVKSNVTDKYYEVDIFDSAGQEDFANFRVSNYEKSDLVLYVNDISVDVDMELVNGWLDELQLKELVNKEVIVLLNKFDICPGGEESIPVKDLKHVIESRLGSRMVGIMTYSALTGHNRDKLIECIDGCLDRFNSSKSSHQNSRKKGKKSCF
ncbi:MAG: hypothetical protein MHPSP_001538 [Paramarteilia canceri]